MTGKAVWNVTKHFRLQATLGGDLNWFTLQRLQGSYNTRI